MKNNNINILIVDDHQIVRNGIKLMLKSFSEFNIIAEAENGEEAVGMVAQLNDDIDVVLMDISMPIMDGIAATRAILKQFPKTKIIALTMHLEESYIKDMMNSGAMGYLLKESDKQVIAGAIKTVHKGGRFVDAEAKNFIKTL